MLDILRILKGIPTATKLYSYCQRAVQGDPEAIEYLKHQGIYEALDAYQPGAGDLGRQILHHSNEAAAGIGALLRGEAGNVIEGEYREVLPWDAPVSWLKARRWGTFVILGPKGQGKTTLAMRMAQVWHNKTGWPVRAVNLYPEDRFDWLEPTPIKSFIAEIKHLVALLNKPVVESGDEAEQWSFMDLEDALEGYKRRIVVIDELSLAVSPQGGDPGRQLVRQIMAQARHMEWLIIYVGQLVRMMPQDLLNSEAVFIKKPSGREALIDRQEPLVIDLWERAIEAFRHVEQAPGREVHKDIRGWAYVDAQDIGGGRRYQGLMPFIPAQQAGTVAPGEESV